jgi:hypothetical protein
MASTCRHRDGEFVVILGPSGCGKSTLLRMIAGLERITGGDVEIGGVRVNDLEPMDRGCAMVFQNYALYPHMNVADNMGYALKVAGVPKAERMARIAAVADTLGLGELLDRKPASCLAASASASPWAAPSCASRRCSCSTSRCPISTPSCGCRCVWRSASCTAALGPRPLRDP